MRLARRIVGEWRHITFNVCFAVTSLLAVLVYHAQPERVAIALVVLGMAGLLYWRSWLTLTIYVFGGAFGVTAESIAVSYGAWAYANPTVVGVPNWLFFLWGAAAAFIYQTSRELRKFGVRN